MLFVKIFIDFFYIEKDIEWFNIMISLGCNYYSIMLLILSFWILGLIFICLSKEGAVELKLKLIIFINILLVLIIFFIYIDLILFYLIFEIRLIPTFFFNYLLGGKYRTFKGRILYNNIYVINFISIISLYF